MDTRRLLSTILVVGVMMLGFNLVMSYLGGGNKHPGVAAVAADEIVTQAFTMPAEPVNGEKLIRLGDPGPNSQDKVAVTINTRGASIEKVELNVNDFANEVVTRRNPTRRPLILFQATPGFAKPYSTQQIHVWMNGQDKSFPPGTTGNFLWKNVSDPANPYEARLQIVNADPNGGGLVKVVKVFRVDPKSYDITISHEVTNLTNVPLQVAIDQLASTDFPQDRRQPDDRFYYAAGIDTTKRAVVADRFKQEHQQLGSEKTPAMQTIGYFQGKDPLAWVASSGRRFFTAITRPMPTQASTETLTLSRDDKTRIPLVDHVGKAELVRMMPAVDPRDALAAITLNGTALTVPAKSELSMPLAVFFGPQRWDVLGGDPHAAEGSNEWARYFYNYKAILLVHSSGCSSWCTFDFLGEALLWMLRNLAAYVTFGNYGLAIILLVIIIRAILHPLTRASQVNMATMGKKMKDVQPLVEAMKKKYAKDKKKQSEEMMRIYRENNVNPAGGVMGCLPMLLQMPIWIAMFTTVRTDIDLFQASFIPGWINDLSVPDRTITFPPFHIPLIGAEISALNVLPLLLAVVIFVQMKVQMASQPKPADEQQAQMQKMSQYMFFLFPLFIYNQPSGLNLYYFGSTFAGLVDTYFVRKTLKRKGILSANASALPTREE
ncbi:MAG: YidC/Oxa1 family insertase periplasmic-domain containing protein [Phycisphaerales bacterium]|nr:YidC/Oxa1 family insertase periplasmic-domain containing protein [Phycisphaerales bacterium]